MKKRMHTKLIREGRYIAEVDVELIETDDDWSPYLSLEDSYKLDDVRNALKLRRHPGGFPACPCIDSPPSQTDITCRCTDVYLLGIYSGCVTYITGRRASGLWFPRAHAECGDKKEKKLKVLLDNHVYLM